MSEKKTTVPTARQAAIDLIRLERQRQDERFGVQNHEPLMWLLILLEEVGELAEEVIQVADPHECVDGAPVVKLLRQAIRNGRDAKAACEDLAMAGRGGSWRWVRERVMNQKREDLIVEETIHVAAVAAAIAECALRARRVA